MGGPSAWTAADYKNNEQWIYRLREEDVKELERAVNGIIDSGVRVQVHMTGQHGAAASACTKLLQTDRSGVLPVAFTSLLP